jgi:hypothetical protein
MSNEIRDKIISEIKLLKYAGKDRVSIVNYLIASGYPYSYVQELADYVYASEIRKFNNLSNQQFKTNNNVPPPSNYIKPINKSKIIILLFIIIFVSVIIVGATYIILREDKTSSYNVDYELRLSKQEFNTGSELSFEAVVLVRGLTDSLSVSYAFNLFDIDNNPILLWQDSKIVTNIERSMIRKDIPSNLTSGKYYILSEIKFGDDEKVHAKTSLFEIINEEIIEIQPPSLIETDDIINNITHNITNDNTDNLTDNITVNLTQNITNNITTDIEEDDYNLYDDIDNNFTDTINDRDLVQEQTDFQQRIINLLEEAKSYAVSNPEKAALTCYNMSETSLIDTCFQQLTKVSENYMFCEEIKDIYLRDYCYITYVFDTKDYQRCDNIVSVKTKNSCHQTNPDYHGVTI